MKKLISILVLMITTVVAQPPVVTQTGSFIVDPNAAVDMKSWGDDFIVSRYSTFNQNYFFYQLILLNRFGEEMWRKEFSLRLFVTLQNIAISNLFCIFTLGDTIYKISRSGELIKSVSFVGSKYVVISFQASGETVVMEANPSSSLSKFFVYNENLDLVRVIAGQPGATYSVVQQGSSYLLSGHKYGGGVVTNVSGHIAKYGTSGNLIWVKQFPDVISMQVVMNQGKLFFCGVDVASPYQRMIYGEMSIESGDTL